MNTSSSIFNALLATTDLGRAFQTHTRRSTSGHAWLIFVGIALAVIALVVLLAYLERRKRDGNVKVDAELILFRNLCRVHGLSAAEINLLLQLTIAKGLAQRCAVFVDPSYLAAVAQRSGDRGAEYAKLHRTLFGRDP